MVAPAALPIAVSPLGQLDRHERQQVVTAITSALPSEDAALVVAALAGTPEEVADLPYMLQVQALEAIIAALPDGLNAVVASRLGIAKKSDEEYLEEVLTDVEKADPAFRQRVEEEAKRRGIQRWLVAIRLRYEGMTPEEYIAAYQKQSNNQTI